MTQEMKRLAEHRHRMVQRYLQYELPNCNVSYNGVEGVDHIISHYDKNGGLLSETYVETKTCQSIISGGINYDLTKPDRPYTFTISRLGRFKFDLRKNKPYALSQHEDLAKKGGWYVFIIGADAGRNIINGIRADQLLFKGNNIVKRVAWGTILSKCYPDWLTRLKHQIYCTKKQEE